MRQRTLGVGHTPFIGGRIRSFHSNKFFPESIKIATDGVALIVNRQNADSIFNVSTLKKIFSGEITRWNQLSADSKLGEIQVVFDHRNSSTVRYVLDSICGRGNLSDRCHAAGTNRDVIEYVTRTPGAMGVIGVNWIMTNRILYAGFSKRDTGGTDQSCRVTYLWE